MTKTLAPLAVQQNRRDYHWMPPYRPAVKWLSDLALLITHNVNIVVHNSGDSTTTRLLLLNHFNRPRKTHSNNR